jgi:hypothetical protein
MTTRANENQYLTKYKKSANDLCSDFVKNAKPFTSVVAISTRDSARYIQELICHNFLVGFDRICIGLDHLTTDNTLAQINALPPQVLAKVAVSVNESTGKVCEWQGQWYNNIAREYYDIAEWLATFDDDEYLYDSQHRPINTILNSLPSTTGCALIPWLVFGHSNHILSPPEGITRLEYFTSVYDPPPLREEYKSIVRLNNINVDNWYGIHFHRHTGDATTLNNEQVFNREDWDAEVVNNDTCLAHYMCGSMEDYVVRCKKWLDRFPGKPQANAGGVQYFMERFTMTGNDTRMSIYATELKQLLAQCREGQ